MEPKFGATRLLNPAPPNLKVAIRLLFVVNVLIYLGNTRIRLTYVHLKFRMYVAYFQISLELAMFKMT